MRIGKIFNLTMLLILLITYTFNPTTNPLVEGSFWSKLKRGFQSFKNKVVSGLKVVAKVAIDYAVNKCPLPLNLIPGVGNVIDKLKSKIGGPELQDVVAKGMGKIGLGGGGEQQPQDVSPPALPPPQTPLPPPIPLHPPPPYKDDKKISSAPGIQKPGVLVPVTAPIAPQSQPSMSTLEPKSITEDKGEEGTEEEPSEGGDDDDEETEEE